MPPELSMRMREHSAEVGTVAPAPVSSPNSGIERRIVEWFCEPLLARIPRELHPNTITVATHFVAWTTFGLAVISPRLPPLGRALALLGAGLGTLLTMIGGCLDGMLARKTETDAKLVEMMGAWLDAIVVPLVPLGMTLALEMPPWAVALVNIAAALVYHSQLVLYHHTGKFVHPDATNGAEAQLGVSLGYMGLAGFFYFVGRHQPWFDLGLVALAFAGLYVELRCAAFYYARLGALVRRHAWFVLSCAGFAALYLLRAIDLYAFTLCIICTSFRFSGSYVLFTLVRRPFDGRDFGVFAFILAIFATRYGLPLVGLDPRAALAALPYLGCLYMLGRNLGDFSRYYGVLRL